MDSQLVSSTAVFVSSSARMWICLVVGARYLLLMYGILLCSAPHKLILPTWRCVLGACGVGGCAGYKLRFVPIVLVFGGVFVFVCWPVLVY